MNLLHSTACQECPHIMSRKKEKKEKLSLHNSEILKLMRNDIIAMNTQEIYARYCIFFFFFYQN